MAEQLLNGRYRLLRPLGTGGMASVYLAEDLRLGRRVAVKILHPQFAADPTFVARFEAEARMAAALSHPNLVQVFDVGHEGDRRYIVMEYVEGETLKELIARQGALPVPRALDIASGVLAALSIAHAHNLIHRDVKSQNILLTSDGDVKVTDFGIAREVGGTAAATLTATGMMIGTVQYFSPEQAQGRPATPQSDLYAVGVVLYEMLTGTLPFEAENPLAVAMQQINQAPPMPTRLNPAIPPSVEAVVLKALSKNPSGRYATANEMGTAIEAARRGAGETTRRATRVTPAVVPPSTQTTRPPAVPGVPRAATRTLSQTPAPVSPAGRTTQRLLWILAALLVAVIAALFGVYASGGLPFVGGGSSATPTATATASATETQTTRPTATHRPVIVPPSATPSQTAVRDTATSTAPTNTATPRATHTRTPNTATATATAAPHTATPTETAVPDTATPTNTATPRATQTRVPDTATPTETPAPATATPTETAVPDTATPTETAVPDTATPLSSPTSAPTAPATAGPPAIQLAPSTTSAGSIVTVSGSGWPAGSSVTLTIDYGAGAQKLGFISTSNGGFTTTFPVPSSTAPGTYYVNARDGRGAATSQPLTVS